MHVNIYYCVTFKRKGIFLKYRTYKNHFFGLEICRVKKFLYRAVEKLLLVMKVKQDKIGDFPAIRK